MGAQPHSFVYVFSRYKGRAEWLWQRLYGLQSRKCLLFGRLQKRFADSCLNCLGTPHVSVSRTLQVIFILRQRARNSPIGATGSLAAVATGWGLGWALLALGCVPFTSQNNRLFWQFVWSFLDSQLVYLGGRNTILALIYLFFKKYSLGDFPGGTVAKTPCSQCRGPGFDPWPGN